MSLCSKCGEREIKIQKRNLCIYCYQKAQKLGGLPPLRKLTFEERRQTIIKNVVKKYGPCFLGDLADLNSKRFITLNEIGQRYGLTRERVRQIYQKIYREKYGEKRKERIENHTDFQTCIHDPRRKVADFAGGYALKGAITELNFLEECEKRGFTYSPCKNAKIDLTINGYLVEVKGRSTTTTQSRGAITKKYNFNCSNEQAENSDFIACYHKHTNSFFIIPTEYIRRLSPTKNLRRHWYINETISTFHNAKNRYWEFQNAWHLLERRQEVAA